jgi:hypothetical protein
MLVAVHEVGVARTPANVTVLLPCEEPKFEPETVTTVPIGPVVGERLVMTGVTARGRTSTMLRLYASPVGAVSLTVTLVPGLAMEPTTCWTHNVFDPGWQIEPEHLLFSDCANTLWFGPTVRAVPAVGSSPTPKTNEFARVVVRMAVGAPDPAVAVARPPMAPDPFVPLVSAPSSATTVNKVSVEGPGE